MSDKQAPAVPSPQSANYSSAVARAVEWLGDRYLLATPISRAPFRSRAESRTPTHDPRRGESPRA
jgi:hypothetical protein